MRFRREDSLTDLEEKVGWLKWKGHEPWEKMDRDGKNNTERTNEVLGG